MNYFFESAKIAVNLIVSFDKNILDIVLLSLGVSFFAVAMSAVVGFPLGGLLALARFPGKNALVLIVNAAMGLPPVVVGLVVYLVLSRAGPLGDLGLLFTPSAMVIAQALLVFPIIAGLARQAIQDLWEEYEQLMRSFGISAAEAILTLLWEGRFRLITVLLAGFGRAIAEVGAVMIVGGNIAGVTRTMTTSIALQTARGDLALALALGAILILSTVMVNGLAQAVASMAKRHNG